MMFGSRFVVFHAWLLILALGFSNIVLAARFEVQRPAKLNISRDIKKVFIDPGLITNINDKFNLKNEVIETLKDRLNALGRFQVIVGPATGFDPNRETVAVIQGDVISGGETDSGQLTEQAECKGGISGLVGAATEANRTQQGITFSRRGMLCKKSSMTSDLVEQGLTAGLSLIGIQEYPRYDEVIRVYKYENVSIFAQVNLSFTKIGLERRTITIRSDAASFSRHTLSPGSYRNVRESGDNAIIIWLWFRLVPIAPVINRQVGVVDASNPGSVRGKWYDYLAPEPADVPKKERRKIVTRLVNKTLTEFIRAISPYRAIIETETASGGNARARELIENGKFIKARELLQGASKAGDLYNLGLAYEASASSVEDYEDALRFYSEAIRKKPGEKLFAQGIGRMEFQLRAYKRIKNQTSK